MHTIHHPHRILLAALALGLAADYLFYERAIGISAPLFVALGLAALAAMSTTGRRVGANIRLATAALFFALCLTWRASATLTALNGLATLGLLALLAIGYCGAALNRLPLERALVQIAAGLGDMAFQPAALASHSARQIPFERAQPRRLRPIGCGLLLALPLLLVFTGLLMSADQVFASYVEQILSFDLPFDVGQLIAHCVFIGMVAWASAGGLLVARLGAGTSALGRVAGAVAAGLIGLVFVDHAAVAAEDLPAEGATQRLNAPRQAPIRLGWVEALTVLVAVDLLFGSFMAIQGAYFFGGIDTLARTGMTYADYARRGFFELLAVACLALGLLCALAILTRRGAGRQRWAFNTASAAMIALVLGLLTSAFERMALYERAYGYTELRVYTHSFMVWLALVLGLFLLALLRERPRVFTNGTCAAALIYLALLNIANPDGLIVRANVGRLGATPIVEQRASEAVDATYLTELSADATPALVAALPQLGPAARDGVLAALAERQAQLRADQQANGWPSWHLGRARASWAIAGVAR